MDRGGDRDKLLLPLIKTKHRFLIRLRKGRDLISQGHTLDGLKTAQGYPMLYLESIIKEEGDQARRRRLEFSVRPVTLPGLNDPLSLVVVRGCGVHGRTPLKEVVRPCLFSFIYVFVESSFN
ncbi:MAG: hypothetical protein WCC06_13100 [Candidatus Aminicenantales bacterium]